MNTCKHEKLTFWSGGYYVACMNCFKRWVALKDQPESDTDFDRVGYDLAGEIREKKE